MTVVIRNTIVCVLIIVGCVALIKLWYDAQQGRVLTRSSFDGRYYLVRDIPQRHHTADALARLNGKIEGLIRYMDTVKDPNHVVGVARLKTRYAPGSISEGVVEKGLTTYTVNKDRITFCLRTRDERDELYGDNILMYVALHELAHIMSVTEQHTPEFYANFDYLQHCAMHLHLFHRENPPIDYCGLTIHKI